MPDIESRLSRIEEEVTEIKELVKPVCEDYSFRRRTLSERISFAKRITLYLGVPSVLFGVIWMGIKLIEKVIETIT